MSKFCFLGLLFFPVATTIRHSPFRVLIPSTPARGGQQHHSPFAICFLGKWMKQLLGVDITIRNLLFLILQLGRPVRSPFIKMCYQSLLFELGVHDPFQKRLPLGFLPP